MQDPSTPHEWRGVAEARKIDASSLHGDGRTLAALYFYGFAVECYAKALLAQLPRYQSKMKQSHNLIELLELGGVPRTSLSTELRRTAEIRDVSLRYQSELPSGFDLDEIKRMQRLMHTVDKRVQRMVDRKLRRTRIREDRSRR
ncbi:hypothetical protein [Curtobacterium sp. NPDC089991]|uniref:hypothetical protein n=1 Tax=Curtobacterium sp. NPDC089991 TaxID=3363969 RepID=UPI0037F6892E